MFRGNLTYGAPGQAPESQRHTRDAQLPSRGWVGPLLLVQRLSAGPQTGALGLDPMQLLDTEDAPVTGHEIDPHAPRLHGSHAGNGQIGAFASVARSTVELEPCPQFHGPLPHGAPPACAVGQRLTAGQR